MKKDKDKEALWAMYSAGMEFSAAQGRGIPDAREIFLAGLEAGILLAKRKSKGFKEKRSS